VVLHCDGYYEIRQDAGGDNEERAARFFAILAQFPMELQMIICNRARGLMKNRVSTKDFEQELKEIQKTF